MKTLDLGPAQVAVVGIPSDDGDLTGLAIVFGTQESAELFADLLKRYLVDSNSKGRAFEMAFSTNPTHSLEVSVSLNDEHANVKVLKLDESVIRSLSESSRKQKYYFIAAAWLSKDELKMVDFNKGHIWKSDLHLNGRQVHFDPQAPFPSTDPLSG